MRPLLSYVSGIWGKEAHPCARGSGMFKIPARSSDYGSGFIYHRGSFVKRLCSLFVYRQKEPSQGWVSDSGLEVLLDSQVGGHPIDCHGKHADCQCATGRDPSEGELVLSNGYLLGMSHNFALMAY